MNMKNHTTKNVDSPQLRIEFLPLSSPPTSGRRIAGGSVEKWRAGGRAVEREWEWEDVFEESCCSIPIIKEDLIMVRNKST